ncbi:folate-binding protein YgfZ [Kangiella sp. HZ709]|uniref:CAF17-like 4Fe-4S cluster assembly/insertion protein YgfZ n=1 Tax=Kangiella sp. HZ709 TaxID=2666328 RepID=UPI0012B11561|nr:folate-binding protein YgfZ [Kangiella sp. HZ709]MRX27357.1 folate-binding protein YgfZ [Kangiella sp. HZ709]
MNNSNQYQILSDYRVIRISGDDSEKFLQGQLTCDLKDANGEKVVIGGYCNVQGRLHATFYLAKINSGYLLVCPTVVAEHLTATLAKYAVFFQTSINLEESLALIAYTNNHQQEDLMQMNLTKDIASKVKVTFALGELAVAILETNHLNDLLQTKLAAYETTSTDIFALQQIRKQIPMVQVSTIETLLPHYIGLPQVGGVNFEKGCYTGQEVVARMHYRGSLKTHPSIAEIESQANLEAGTPIVNHLDKKVGELINSAVQKGSKNKLVALISLADKALQDELSVAGHPLQLLSAD